MASIRRLDPSRTGMIRRRFISELNKRFNKLIKAIYTEIVTDDVFGLLDSEGKSQAQKAGLQTLQYRAYQFLTTPQKMRAFQNWLQIQIDTGILSVSGGISGQPWTATYVESAYKKAAMDAYIEANKKDLLRSSGWIQGSRESFLRTAFAQPEMLSKIELLSTRAFQQLQGITATMSQQISVSLANGLSHGWSPLKIARDIQRTVSNINRVRARRIARTECLTGDTLVDRAMIGAVFRRFYNGDIVEIVTGSGTKFSATPNHPMLTQHGWIGAGFIKVGDNLICDNRQQDFSSSGNKNIKRNPSKISEIFDSLSAISITERIRTTQPDFHGDGMEGQVDILRPDRLLSIGDFSSISEPLKDYIFTPSGRANSEFCSFCGRLLSIDKNSCLCPGSKFQTRFNQASLDSALSHVIIESYLDARLTGQIPALDNVDVDILDKIIIDPSIFPSKSLSIGNGTRDTFQPQNLSNLLLVRADPLSDFPLSEAGQIKFDNVVSVRFRPFSGHVYNLQTPYGYFTINNIYTGNTINAHAEGQLDAFEQMGFKEVGVIAELEFTTAGDALVCPICQALEGQSFTIEQARGIIPGQTHPNCRCSWTPVVKS